MRLAGKIKGGFYPTPTRTLYAIQRMLKPASGSIRILDPCAGKGAAIDEIRWALRSTDTQTGARALITPYGVEPELERIYELRRALGQETVIHGH